MLQEKKACALIKQSLFLQPQASLKITVCYWILLLPFHYGSLLDEPPLVRNGSVYS